MLTIFNCILQIGPKRENVQLCLSCTLTQVQDISKLIEVQATLVSTVKNVSSGSNHPFSVIPDVRYYITSDYDILCTAD